MFFEKMLQLTSCSIAMAFRFYFFFTFFRNEALFIHLSLGLMTFRHKCKQEASLSEPVVYVMGGKCAPCNLKLCFFFSSFYSLSISSCEFVYQLISIRTSYSIYLSCLYSHPCAIRARLPFMPGCPCTTHLNTLYICFNACWHRWFSPENSIRKI